jgi:16S rRNA processing protein RimM
MVQLVVGRVARAHGIRGEVLVQIRTDSPDDRFAEGAVLATDPADAGPLTVDSVRHHSGRLRVAFAGVADRTAAEALRGVRLVVDSADLPPPEDPEEYHDHQLIGLAAVGPDGGTLGEVVDVLHSPGTDMLVVARAGHQGDGTNDGEVLVPFVHDIVPTVDVTAGRLVVDPPPGLLEL